MNIPFKIISAILAGIYAVTIVLLGAIILWLSAYFIARSYQVGIANILDVVVNLWRGVALSDLENEIAFRFAQSALLSLSLILIVRPQVMAVIDAIRSQRGPVHRRSSWRQRDINVFAAERLAEAYARADEIFVVSGDYSWLAEHDPKGIAKENLLRKHKEGKAKIVSYKSEEAVRIGLSKLPEDAQNRLIACMSFNASFKDVKASMIKENDMRELWILTLNDKNDKKELVQIVDIGHGRKILGIIQKLLN